MAKRKRQRPTCPEHPECVVRFGTSHLGWGLFRCGCEWSGGIRVVKGGRV